MPNDLVFSGLFVLIISIVFNPCLIFGQTETTSIQPPPKENGSIKQEETQPANTLLESVAERTLIEQAQLAKNNESEELVVYNESRLRRFEIISLTSIPFVAIHSFLAVRGVNMIQQNKFAPKISDNDYRIIGICTITSSILIGLWDLYNNRGKNASELLIPEIEQSPLNRPLSVPRSSRLNEIDDIITQPTDILALLKIGF